jgi:hypothetical protein
VDLYEAVCSKKDRRGQDEYRLSTVRKGWSVGGCANPNGDFESILHYKYDDEKDSMLTAMALHIMDVELTKAGKPETYFDVWDYVDTEKLLDDVLGDKITDKDAITLIAAQIGWEEIFGFDPNELYQDIIHGVKPEWWLMSMEELLKMLERKEITDPNMLSKISCYAKNKIKRNADKNTNISWADILCAIHGHDYDPNHGCNWEFLSDEEYCRRCGRTFPKE